MHEASLMGALLKKIEQLACEQGANEVVEVSVWLGALSQMSVGHFQEHFDQLRPGTIVEGARLVVELSDDIDDANAQDLMLRSIEVES